MNKVTKIFNATVKARIGGCDENAVIAETENGKIFCLFHMGTAHGFNKITMGTAYGFNKIAKGYTDDIGLDIESFEKAFEVEKLVSRKGREYFQAKVSRY